jgi:rhodanese-related sulfurtransferase
MTHHTHWKISVVTFAFILLVHRGVDVRNEDEIAYTGKLSACVETLPLPLIAQMGAFRMSEEDFEENFGFAKPKQDETIIFTCKAGIRSMHAAQYAAMNGYSKLVNYSGGAMDWFRS